MKKLFLFATAVAAMTVVSCQQAEVEQIASEGQRTVTVAFDNGATRTALGSDGQTPVWQAGDVIRLLDEITYEDITITAEDIAKMKGETISLTFKTNLTGWPLYAIYPASATDMTVAIDEQVSIKIPVDQDGTFASANICAAMGDGDDMMLFRNVTSVLKITQQEAAVLGIKVEAENAISGECLVSFTEDGGIYNTMLKPGTASSIVSTCANEPKDCYYLAVASKVTTGNTKMTFIKGDGYAEATKPSKNLVVNTMYNLGNIDDLGLDFKTGRGLINGHEYVQIAGLKWATENLAISDAGKSNWVESGHIIGDFFRWGETDLLYDEIWIKNLPSNDNDPGFHFLIWYEEYQAFETFWKGWGNFDFDKIGEGNKLLPEFDPAAKYWGSTWHMPEGGENNDFETLFKATYWAFDNTNNFGCYVFEPDASHPAGKVEVGLNGLNRQDALLYFPACGWGLTSGVSNTGYQVRQWTNHYTPGATKKESLVTAFNIIYNEKDIVVNKWNIPTEKIMNQSKYGWWLGYNIRPVSK